LLSSLKVCSKPAIALRFVSPPALAIFLVHSLPCPPSSVTSITATAAAVVVVVVVVVVVSSVLAIAFSVVVVVVVVSAGSCVLRYRLRALQGAYYRSCAVVVSQEALSCYGLYG
jgi:hypothetical protein